MISTEGTNTGGYLSGQMQVVFISDVSPWLFEVGSIPRGVAPVHPYVPIGPEN